MSLPALWKHQELAVNKAKEKNHLALFLDLGTGKTRTTIEILRHHCNVEKRIPKTLIICPSSVCGNWVQEIKKYSKIPDKSVKILDMDLRSRAKIYADSEGISIVNFEACAYEIFSKTLLDNPPEILIIDESHRVKDIKAKRTKVLIKLSDLMSRKKFFKRYILTGSPVLNSHLDLFTQFRILDGGETFGTNFFQFRAKYFYNVNANARGSRNFALWKVRPSSEDKLKALMAPSVVQAKKEECLDLPPLLKTCIEVEMSSEQKQAYQQMKKEFITFVESGVATANLAITKALRMQQILSGHIKLEDGSVHVFKDNPRVQALKDFLEDYPQDEKVIIWSIFHEDYHAIRKVVEGLGIEYAEVTGLVDDKQAEIDRFREDPKCRVMIASQAAGGTGVNMTTASTMVYYSRSYSLEHDMQSEARNYRGGSEIHEKVTRIDLVARGTVDEVVLNALRNKKDMATRILELKNLL